MKELVAVIVEDHPVTAEILSDVCRRGGFTPIVYQKAFDALAGLQELRPDILITDVYMPQMSGRVLLRTISESPYSFQGIPIVVLTGDKNAEDIATEGDGLNILVLVKPYGIDQLSHYLDELRSPGGVRKR
ncbi:MAG: response regulator [Alphaproteobacteria bacterium]